jgi:hypothetical protein
MSLRFSADVASSLTDAGRLGTQLGIVDHLLHVAQSIRPLAEVVAGQRREVARIAARWSAFIPAPFSLIVQTLLASLTALPALSWLRIHRLSLVARLSLSGLPLPGLAFLRLTSLPLARLLAIHRLALTRLFAALALLSRLAALHGTFSLLAWLLLLAWLALSRHGVALVLIRILLTLASLT